MEVWLMLVAASLFVLAFWSCSWSLISLVRKWKTSIELTHLFPHTENWSYLRGTLKELSGPEWMADFLQQHLQLTERFKYAYSAFIGPKMVAALVVVHPEPVQAILKGSDGKATSYEFLRPWLGDGLLLAKGKKWHRNRKLLTPAFHFGILKAYVDIYNLAAEDLLAKMAGHCSSNEKYWDVSSDINLASLDIILQCAFSCTTHCQTDVGNEYVKAVMDLEDITLNRTLRNPLMRIDSFFYLTSDGRRERAARNIAHTHARCIIEKRQQELADCPASIDDDASNAKRLDFLDILLTVKDADNLGMSDEDVQAEVDTFLFEGHDTTSSAVSWALYHLATQPEHMTVIQDEVDSVMVGKHREVIEWDDLPKLKHLALFIKEAMRLSPPVSMIGRYLENDVTVCGKLVPKGTQVHIWVHALHHNRHVWGDDVEEFKPERFLPEKMEKMHPYSYVPFSAGPRNCIGQNFAMNEVKVMLARILRRFSLRPHPTVQPRPSFNLVLKHLPNRPILLSLHPRQ